MAARRPRARCRRVEACWLLYLVLTSHLAPLGSRGVRGNQVAGSDDRALGPGPGLRAEEIARVWAGACDGRSNPACGRTSGGGAECHRRWHAANWWTTTVRFGEALHPGPFAATVAADGLLRRVFTAARKAIAYPTPGKESLRAAIAPGFPSARPAATDLFALRVESVNSTGWKGLQKRLAATKAHVVLAQETWLTPDSIPAASAWAKRRGWKSVWSAAVPGPNGGASGGTAIFARDYLGLRYPPGGTHEWVAGRAVAAVLDAPAMRPLLLISCYLVHGIGPAQANLDILAEIGRRRRAAAEDYEVCMGGDINMEPPDFAATGFDVEMDASIMYPSTDRGTFRTARAASLIDYFVISTRTAAAVQKIETIEAAGVKGHTPVLVTFRPEVTSLRALHLRRPPRLAEERVVGPLPPPPDWTDAKQAAQRALDAARAGGDDAQDLLDFAYRSWADLAEIELADYAGQFPKKLGERGLLPRLVWRSVIPEAAPKGEAPVAAAAAWLGSVAAELERIRAAATRQTPQDADAGEDLGLLDDDFTTEVTDDEIRRARARRPPTAAAACRRIATEISASLEVDCPNFGEGAPAARLQRVRDYLANAAASLAEGRDLQESVTERRGNDDPPGGLADCRSEAKAIETEATAVGDADDRRRWREWVSEGIEAGAARAHAYSRSPTAWAPSAAQLPDGSSSAAVEDLINEQRAKYTRLWKPADKPFRYQWGDEGELPPITVARLREAAATFSRRTTTTYDGFHPRQLAVLSDESLATLSLLYAAVEAGAMWPRQVALIVASLLPKASGGHRPIGIAPAVYRLWSKARRAEADEWEARHPRAFFSACRGNGPVDTMWRLAARQEARCAEGEVAATISEDVQSFFETVDRARLVTEARALGFPIPVLKAALAAYSAARVVTMNGRISREVYPEVGVVAGCSLAMALTKLYCIRAFDEVTEQIPPAVKLDTFVDDLTLSATGTPPSVLDDLLRAHAILSDAVNATLRCTLAPGKTAWAWLGESSPPPPSSGSTTRPPPRELS